MREAPLSVRAPNADLWRDAARAAGLSLSAWVIKVCDQATKGEDVTQMGPCPHHYTANRLVCVDCKKAI